MSKKPVKEDYQGMRGVVIGAEVWLEELAKAQEKEVDRLRTIHPDWASIHRGFAFEVRTILAKLTTRRLEAE